MTFFFFFNCQVIPARATNLSVFLSLLLFCLTKRGWITCILPSVAFVMRMKRCAVSVHKVSRLFVSFKMHIQAQKYWLYEQQSFVAGVMRMHKDLKCNHHLVWQWLMVHKETTPTSVLFVQTVVWFGIALLASDSCISAPFQGSRECCDYHGMVT